MKTFFKKHKSEIVKITLVFATWRIILFIIATLAPIFFEYKPTFPFYDVYLQTSGMPAWIYSFANFDGVHYITIAEKGYHAAANIQAFFPLYPIIISFLNALTITNMSVVLGLLISNISFLFLLYVWCFFIKDTISSTIAWRSLILLLIFPTSFYFGSMYTESVFFLFVIASFFSAHKKKWWLAGLFATLASATRIVGIFLVPALLFELLEQNNVFSSFQFRLIPTLQWKKVGTLIYKTLLQQWKNVSWIIVGSLGLVGYMIFLYKEFNDPLYFFHVQSEFGSGRQESIILFPQVVYRYIKIFLTVRPIDWKFYAYIQEFVMTLGTLTILILSFRKKYKIQTSWLIFSLLCFFLPTLTGNFSSMPRYILICFPLFLTIAHMTKKQWKYILFFLISLVLLILNTMLFIQGYWVA